MSAIRRKAGERAFRRPLPTKADLWLGSLPPAADLTGMAFLDFGIAKSGSAPGYERPRSGRIAGNINRFGRADSLIRILRFLMKTLFLGSFGARPGVWEAILAKTTEKLDISVLFDVEDTQRLSRR